MNQKSPPSGATRNSTVPRVRYCAARPRRSAASIRRARVAGAQIGGRGDLDQFLVPALQAAIALEEMGHRARAIAQDLDLDMAGGGN